MSEPEGVGMPGQFTLGGRRRGPLKRFYKIALKTFTFGLAGRGGRGGAVGARRRGRGARGPPLASLSAAILEPADVDLDDG